MGDERRVRVLISKAGLDGHDRGAKVVSTMLRNEGFEVIYLGRFQTAESIVSAAVEEDVDVIGLSTLCGEYRTYVPRIRALMKERGLEHVLFIVGGVIPHESIPQLKEAGVDEVFPSGSTIRAIADYIRDNVRKRRQP
jgi:methylmalonyl-CoA mutase C-terminal domain/subunit